MSNYFFTLLFLVLRVAEVFSQLTLTLVITNSKVSIKRLLIGSMLFTIIFEPVSLFIPQYLLVVLSFILATSILIFIFKIHYIKSVLSYLITSITTAIIDCIVSLSIYKICDLTVLSEITQSRFLTFCGRLTVTIILLFIAVIVKEISRSRKEPSIANVTKSLSLVTLIVTFFLLFPNLIMIIYYHNSKPLPLAIIIINILAIIATFFISIFNTQRGIKFIQNEEELITEKTYNKALQDLVDSLKTFKHDYNNTIQTMHGYIFMKDMDGLTEYFEDVMKEAKTITALDKLNSELFNDPSIFSLITAKFEYAKKNNVTMTFDMQEKFNNLDIKSYDFSRILGILLDNAVEAATTSKNKFVKIYTVKENEKVTIEISNSFSPTELNVEDMDKKGTSSKGENRGLGLYKVKDILSKYPQIIHEVTASNNVFLQKLVIDKVSGKCA